MVVVDNILISNLKVIVLFVAVVVFKKIDVATILVDIYRLNEEDSIKLRKVVTIYQINTFYFSLKEDDHLKNFV